MANRERIDREEALKVVEYYINSNDSAKEVAFEFGVSEYRIRKCLKAAVENGWISSEKIEILKRRVVSHQGKRGPKSARVMTSYQDKEKVRNEIRQLKAERMKLLFRIEELKNNNTDGIQLETALKRLKEVEELIERYQNRLNFYKKPRRKR